MDRAKMKKLGLLFLLLILTACSDSKDQQSILDRSNCAFPCWNGIVVGETTKTELLTILGALPDIDQESIEITDASDNVFDNNIYFSFLQGWTLSQRPKIDGYLDITDDKVGALTFCGEINMTIGELAEQVGEPENIISGNDIGGGRTAILTLPAEGIAFWHTAELSNLEITPDTQIDCLEFFDPSLYHVMLEIGSFSAGYYNAEETLRVMYSWDGYGNLDEKYPPRQP
jgi:hypothetical protein